MNTIKYILGSEEIESSPLCIFDEEVCEFLNEFSATLLKSPLVKIHKDLSALPFWARKAHIQKLKENFSKDFFNIKETNKISKITASSASHNTKKLRNMEIRMGRGLYFHISPSNIPLNFAFSYFFSLLARNANIVRVPSKNFAQMDALIPFLATLLKKYPTLEKRSAFIRYPVNNAITAQFSLKAHAHMIWGGDATISQLKGMPTQARCVDVSFSDRYSVCILDGEKILKEEQESLKRLAKAFYNDTYLMDQNACSSPKLVLWQNNSDEARHLFWSFVLEEVEQNYILQDAVAVDKYTNFCKDYISFQGITKTAFNANLLYRMELSALETTLPNSEGRAGYFYEYALQDYQELFAIITEKYQTITYFGIDTTQFTYELMQSGVKGIDRIVPVGKALDINIIWDGYDIIRTLSRIIHVE